MSIHKVVYKDVEGDTNELIDKVKELAKRHNNMLSAITIVDDNIKVIYEDKGCLKV